MAKPFEVIVEQDVEATPEQAWEAISTGVGMDGWWMGSSTVEPRLGGAVRTILPGFTMESTITTWDLPHRFVNTSPQAPDGRLMAFDFTIEARAGGTTHVRLVHSGFLPDEIWADEFDALKKGDPAYVFKLAEYLRYFRGRQAVPVSVYGPQVDADHAWRTFHAILGVGQGVEVGAPVRFTPTGLPEIDGVIDYRSSDLLGVRTADAMYRFFVGMGIAYVGHHIFTDVDPAATQAAWEAWLSGLFAEVGAT
jgi:uncharacterized protein YndB with AHSA1/START domain